ncbi:helix-turn-helix domain-containing protein [Aquirhabdus parva]|uniref:XRE family transcriptional regulator n=1 Tax=Aquirhabdus parva TaxID=2283318 RepID=A0A345P8L3_9GAMM|nr:helix-turn-helix transcriptional regulator [Aquirhabdus parva]AXI03622.1 XRE family transcriptional regulator [Aquirhabdus parva]
MTAELDLYTSVPALIGSLLAKRRIERDLSQTEAAHFLDIGNSSWSRIENGESSLTIEQLFSICHGMDLKPSGFLALVEEKRDLLARKGVVVSLHKLSKKKQVKLADALKGKSGKDSKGTFVMEVTGTGLWPLIGNVIFESAGLITDEIAPSITPSAGKNKKK